MSDKEIDQELLAMFANTKMEAQQSYLARGRALHADDTETLVSNWLVQINAWADDMHGFERKLMDDIEAELGLRGIDAPLDKASEAIEKIKARSRAVAAKWRSSPEELELAEELLQVELAKIRPSKTDKN